MKKQLKSFRIKTILWLSVGLFLLPLAPSLAINLALCGGSFFDMPWIYIPVVLVSYFVLVAVHELIHAITALLFGGLKRKDIEFGVVKEQLMFYCHAKAPMTARAYRAVLIMPLIFTGIIPLVVSVVWGNPYLIILFSMLISGAAGDVVMFNETLKYKPTQLIEDHPKAPAYYLLYEDDAVPDGFVEVTAEAEEALMSEIYKTNKRK